MSGMTGARDRKRTAVQLVYDFKYQQNSNQKMYRLYTIFIVLLFLYQAQSQCCLKIQGRACLNCPNGTHLFRGNCIIDVDNCLTYADGFDCATCSAGFQLNGPSQCQPIPVPQPVANIADFTDVVIDPKSVASANSDAYSLSVDYFKSFKAQLKNADAVGAIVRTYKNGTVQVTIQFQDSGANKYYRGVIQPDLQTFIFKQISFSTITALTIIKATPTSITPSPSSDAPIVQTIDVRNSAHKQKLQLLETEAKKISTFFSAFVSGSMTTYTNGSSDISATYNGSNSGETYSVQGTISKDKKVTKVNVKLVSGIQPRDASGITPNIPSYIALDPSSTEQGFLISTDFLSVQLPKYNGLVPSKLFKASTADTSTLYKYLFTLSDGSTWQVVTSFDSNTFTVSLMSQIQTSSSVRALTVVYTKLDLASIYLDFQFLIVTQYVNKQSNNKYKDAVIKSVEKAQDDANNVMRYRVTYEYGGFNWEVLAQINTISYVASGYQETKKDAVAKPILGSTPNITNNTGNSTTNSTKNTTTANTTTANTVTPNTTTANPNTVTANTTPNITSNTSTAIKNTTVTANNTKNTTTATTTTTVVPNNPTPTPATTNTVVSTRSSLPQKVVDNVIGQTELSTDQAAGPEFKDIDTLLRSVNPQLSGASYLGAFYTTTSFTRNYKIYYMKSPMEIYEVKLTRDNLRKKTYIVSFVKIS